MDSVMYMVDTIEPATSDQPQYTHFDTFPAVCPLFR